MADAKGVEKNEWFKVLANGCTAELKCPIGDNLNADVVIGLIKGATERERDRIFNEIRVLQAMLNPQGAGLLGRMEPVMIEMLKTGQDKKAVLERVLAVAGEIADRLNLRWDEWNVVTIAACVKSWGFIRADGSPLPTIKSVIGNRLKATDPAVREAAIHEGAAILDEVETVYRGRILSGLALLGEALAAK